MTREEAKKVWPIVKAWAEGETIEYSCGGAWKEVDGHLWVGLYKYRIKPKSDYSPSETQEECCYMISKHKPFGTNYRPFKTQEECWNEMLKHQPFGWIKEKNTRRMHIINSVSVDSVNSASEKMSGTYSGSAFDNYEFADGYPFGVKI